MRKLKALLVFIMAALFVLGSMPVVTNGVTATAAAPTLPDGCTFTIEGSYLKNLEVGTTVGELKYLFDTSVTVKHGNSTLSATDAISTGDKVTVSGSTFTAIVDSDVNGDGNGSDNDADVVKQLLTAGKTMTELEKLVADTNGDGEITTSDYFGVKFYDELKLLVSVAPSTVSVPNLSGMTETEAQAALEKLGLKADIRYTTEGTAGEVSYQKTENGTKVGEGASIVVVVSFDGKYAPLNYEDMKGIWFYQYASSYTVFKASSSSQRPETTYRNYVSQIINNLASDGYNTIFVQMRPYGDSFYPSEIYPPSPYAANSSSYNGSFSYDPLEIFIEIAHAKGISIHAWLNPMRLMTTSGITSVDSKYRLRQWYNDTSKRGDYIVANGGRYYLNPAHPETRQLVVDGVMEICENYDIDGIHFDDYFYISIDSESTDLAFDQKAFDKYAPGSPQTLDFRKAWRRNNVNKLLKEIYDAIDAYDGRILFGISPAGNIDNNQSGYLCADVKKWCSSTGYIDYIAPQVYWSFNYKYDFAKFDICSNNWANLCTSPSVRLIIGMAPYRCVNASYSSTDPGWYNYKDNMKRMLQYTDSMERCSGWIMFKYESIYNLYAERSYNSDMMAEINNMLPYIPTWGAND